LQRSRHAGNIPQRHALSPARVSKLPEPFPGARPLAPATPRASGEGPGAASANLRVGALGFCAGQSVTPLRRLGRSARSQHQDRARPNQRLDQVRDGIRVELKDRAKGSLLIHLHRSAVVWSIPEHRRGDTLSPQSPPRGRGRETQAARAHVIALPSRGAINRPDNYKPGRVSQYAGTP
jgi:hypothetical protein